MRVWIVAGVCLIASAALADPVYDVSQFRAYENDGSAAYHAGHYAEAEGAYASATLYSPQQGGGFYNLAAAAARAGDRAKALAALDHFASFGLAVNLDRDNTFAALRSSPDFARIREKLAANTAPICACNLVFQGKAEPFIAEGITQDIRTARIFVSSVAQRKIVAIHDGVMRDFARVPDGMSALGIRINDAHDLVWAAASTLPQSDGGSGDMGQAALLAFDITSGALRAKYPAPVYAPKRSFSDLTFAPDGTVYVSDAIEGSIFRLKPGDDALETVGTTKRFSSPQGMVVSSDGRILLVADYVAGLQLMNIATGDVQSVAVPAGITTLGMDGLVQLPDGGFAATQNGFAPNRVVHFRLSKDWSRLVSFTVMARGGVAGDVSLLSVDGNNVLAIGESQWASFGENDATPAKPLNPWRVLRVTMP